MRRCLPFLVEVRLDERDGVGRRVRDEALRRDAAENRRRRQVILDVLPILLHQVVRVAFGRRAEKQSRHRRHQRVEQRRGGVQWTGNGGGGPRGRGRCTMGQNRVELRN